MSVAQMRVAVIKVYPASKGWHAKVMKMSDAQVQAIYFKFLNEKKIK